MIILYGIKNCNSCLKGKKWLISNKIEFKYHDFRNHGLTDEISGKSCIDYFIKQPTLIKRPIIKDGQSMIIGYKPDVYQLKLNP